MYHQFNIQQFYVLPTHNVFVCFVWISEQTAIISLHSINRLVLGRLLKIAKSDYYLRCVCLSLLSSARPRATTPIPLDGFSRNVMFECFAKICPENSRFIKVWWDPKGYLHMKTYVHLWQYLAEFFLELEIFQKYLKLYMILYSTDTVFFHCSIVFWGLS